MKTPEEFLLEHGCAVVAMEALIAARDDEHAQERVALAAEADSLRAKLAECALANDALAKRLDEAERIVRVVATMDCFVSGAKCAPGCDCLSAQASAVTPPAEVAMACMDNMCQLEHHSDNTHVTTVPVAAPDNGVYGPVREWLRELERAHDRLATRVLALEADATADRDISHKTWAAMDRRVASLEANDTAQVSAERETPVKRGELLGDEGAATGDGVTFTVRLPVPQPGPRYNLVIRDPKDDE